MKKNTKRILSAAAGISALAAGTVQPVLAQQEASVENNVVISVNQESRDYVKVESAKGTFSFTQDVVTPSDELFSLFGTALTGLCATPSYVFEDGAGMATKYVNVSGDIRKAYTVDLQTLAGEGKETTRVTLCACSTGPASAVGEITGIKLADVIQMADMDPGVNAVKIVGSDGYGSVLPLQYALEKEALIVYKVGNDNLPSNTQFWIPETVAKYFTRDVVDVELIKMDEVPEVENRADEYRAQVNILNSADSAAIAVGDEIAFEGYADDVGDPIATVEFSLDGGEHWTAYETPNATSESWVYWNFGYKPEKAGDYKLTVRATTKGGLVSPLLSSVSFSVAQMSTGAIGESSDI